MKVVLPLTMALLLPVSALADEPPAAVQAQQQQLSPEQVQARLEVAWQRKIADEGELISVLADNALLRKQVDGLKKQLDELKKPDAAAPKGP